MKKYYRYEICLAGSYRPFHLDVKESMFDIINVDEKDYYKNETGNAFVEVRGNFPKIWEQNKPETWYLDSLYRLNEMQIQAILVQFVGTNYIDRIKELYDTINRLHEKNRIIHCAKLNVAYMEILPIETNEENQDEQENKETNQEIE